MGESSINFVTLVDDYLPLPIASSSTLRIIVRSVLVLRLYSVLNRLTHAAGESKHA